MGYLDKLNEQQIEAVKHKEGACLVMAGAGSGKTSVLTSRIAYLIEQGIWSSNILAITFTNKAAKEMRERVYNIVGETKSFIGTFHSFGLKIIRENPEKFNLTKSFSILDSDDSLTVIKKILKDKNLDSKKFNPNYIKNKISSLKNEILTQKEIEQSMNTMIDKIVLDVFKKYEETLEKSNALDFDDLLIKPVKVFMKDQELLEKYQDHYPYVLIDEFQDTNPVQYMLSKLISKKYGNIFVVGDMNQSIYSFRHADYRNILHFERDFKDAKIIKLEQNYRSTQIILDAANSVIKNNIEKKDLKLWSNNKNGDKIEYMRGYDGVHEIKLVADEIQKLYPSYNDYKSFAILYRTNAQSRTIEQTLLASGIPYKIFGGFSYLNRKEIKDLISYLKLINNNQDEISLRRIINVPKRGIGEAALNKLEDEAMFKNLTVFDVLASKKEIAFKEAILDMGKFAENNTLTDLIDYVLNRSGIKESYESEESLDAEIRLDNLMEFKSLTKSYENRTNSNDLGDFLNEISLMSDNDESHSDNAVTLMTLHSAKGLEFDVVFLVGMEENLFPHANSLFEENGLDEERRLCYVGITRAKQKLYITNAKRRMLYGKDEANMPSRFINEIDEKLINNNAINIQPKIIKPNDMYTDNTHEYKAGDIIKHEQLGNGIVINVSGDLLNIAFKSGVKMISKNHKSIRKD